MAYRIPKKDTKTTKEIDLLIVCNLNKQLLLNMTIYIMTGTIIKKTKKCDLMEPT